MERKKSVDDILRGFGLDPAQVGKRGEALSRVCLANERLKLAIGEALNALGAPTMDYSPANAVREYAAHIRKASNILVEAIRRLDGCSAWSPEP